MAPSGTRWSVVYFQRSHIKQRNGHSRFVRKRVATSSTLPPVVRSGSTKKACGCHGSAGGFGGRCARIQRSFSSRFIERMEGPAIGSFVGGKEFGSSFCCRTVLESAFLIDRHVETREGFHAARDHFSLESVKPLVAPVG